MSSISVKSGKGEIKLQKSTNLVGLKGTTQQDLSEEKYVEKEVIPSLGGFQVVSLTNGNTTVDDRLDEVRAVDEVAVGTHVYYAEGSNRPMVPTGDIYITFNAGVSEEEQLIVLDEFHLELVERRSTTFMLTRVTAQSPNPLKAAAAIQQLSLVATAEPDLDMPLEEYAFAVPRDSLLPHQWHLQNSGFVVDANFSLKKGADSRVVNAWNRLGNTGSSNITVAVIDNGFDVNHPDLKAKVHKPWDLTSRSSRLPQGNPSFEIWVINIKPIIYYRYCYV